MTAGRHPDQRKPLHRGIKFCQSDRPHIISEQQNRLGSCRRERAIEFELIGRRATG